MTLNITGLIVTQHNDTEQNAAFLCYVECRYAECRCAECRGAKG
jgi:hypothetical protein